MGVVGRAAQRAEGHLGTPNGRAPICAADPSASIASAMALNSAVVRAGTRKRRPADRLDGASPNIGLGDNRRHIAPASG